MKKKCIRFILLLVFLTGYQSLSIAGTYEFGRPEVPFILTHLIFWDGTESENITFSISSTGDQDWFDETSGDVRLPIIGDVINTVRLQGPEGLDLITSETVIPWTPFYSIEGNYKTDPVRIEYKYRAYSAFEYQVNLPDEFCPHPAGNYTLTVSCADGQTLVSELPYIAAKDFSVLPPPTNLALTLNNDGSILGNWTNPIVYPDGVNLRARIEVFKDGIFQNFRLRLRQLPSNLTQITFDKEFIDMLLIHGNEFKFLVQAVWYIDDSGVTNENYANSERINYFYENNSLVKRDYVPKKDVVVIPLMQ